ncbi:carbohydrate ABC transporter permease [Lactiplantibacillus carotarum]|uniref:carbohydrate ABC transporter permease n=1 Tax=Lactiplantibacillus carotarum TaxID=2993456 RepID=UPI00298F3930|nr:carbohydrate ABC transporter permease [Lactiplantibacillus carotarum]
MTSSSKASSVLKYVFIVIMSFISIFPFIWMLIECTNSSADILAGKMSIGSHFMTNWHNAFTQTNLIGDFWNSLKIAFMVTVLSIIVAALAAYGFQIYRSRGKNWVYSIFIASMMIPFSVLMIPLYRMVSKLGLINTSWAVILPSIMSVFLVFFFHQSLESFPLDTIESARIDGANELRIFWSIVLPQLRSTFAAAAIYSFMGAWNNYMWPLIVLQSDDQKTLPLLISGLSANTNFSIDYGVIMILIIISTIPIFLIFLFLQKYFVQGMTGASKG